MFYIWNLFTLYNVIVFIKKVHILTKYGKINTIKDPNFKPESCFSNKTKTVCLIKPENYKIGPNNIFYCVCKFELNESSSFWSMGKTISHLILHHIILLVFSRAIFLFKCHFNIFIIFRWIHMIKLNFDDHSKIIKNHFEGGLI